MIFVYGLLSSTSVYSVSGLPQDLVVVAKQKRNVFFESAKHCQRMTIAANILKICVGIFGATYVHTYIRTYVHTYILCILCISIRSFCYHGVRMRVIGK